MAVFKMVVTSTETLQGKMSNIQNTIAEQIAELEKAVNAVIDNEWVGSSATKFKEDYESWHVKIQADMGELQSLVDRLKKEAEELEEIAAMLDSLPPTDFRNTRVLRDWWHGIVIVQMEMDMAFI